MMYSLYDKINVKRIQARFKKYIHTKKCVDMNFLHFVGVWISNTFFWVCVSWPQTWMLLGSSFKFHSNLFALCVFDTSHHHYFLADFLDRGRRKIQITLHRKVLWRPKTRKTNCYDWELLVLIGCFKRDNGMKWIEVSISLVQIYQAPALQMESTLLKLFYMEQPLRRLSVRRGDVWRHSPRVKIYYINGIFHQTVGYLRIDTGFKRLKKLIQTD